MIEIMTGIGSTSDLPEPTGDIKGEVQNMGIIPGLPSLRGTDEFCHFGSKVYCGFSSLLSNGDPSKTVYEVDVSTKQVRVVGNDQDISATGRLADVDAAGQNITMYGGTSTSPASTRKISVATGEEVRTQTSFGYAFVKSAHATYNDNYFLFGPSYANSCYRITFPTTGTTSTGTVAGVTPVSFPNGYAGCVVGVNLWAKVKESAQYYRFNMATQSVTSVGGPSFHTWCSGVYDGSRYIYWLQGMETEAIQGVRRFDTTTNSWDATYGLVPLTGSKPTSYYPTRGLKLVWFNKAIYFFRIDQDTSEGRSLYRII